MSALLDAIRRFFYPIAAAYMRKADVERRFVEFLHRGEIAEAPSVYIPPELPPCGMRISLTREQVDAAIADLDQQFPKTKDRRIR